MKITIITAGQPYIFEKVSYVCVEHEEELFFRSSGEDPAGLVIEEVAKNGSDKSAAGRDPEDDASC